jgi:hypothetical protein
LQAFGGTFGAAAYEDISQRWQGKLQRAVAGEQLWAKVTAVKPLACS